MKHKVLRIGFRFFLFALLVSSVPIILQVIAALLGFDEQFWIAQTHPSLFIATMVLLFFLMKRNDLEQVKTSSRVSQAWFLVGSLLSFAAYFVVKYAFPWKGISTHFTVKLLFICAFVFYSVGVFLLFLAMFSWVFLKQYKTSILGILFTTIFYYGFNYIILKKMAVFTFIVAKIIATPLSWTGSLSLGTTSTNDPLIVYNGFHAGIGTPCSGVQSLNIFMLLSLLLLCFDWNKLRKGRKAMLGISLLGGLVGVYLVNIVRVYVLMLIGGHFSPHLVEAFFHDNAGWVIFSLFTVGYWAVLYPRLFKKSAPRKIVGKSNTKTQKNI